ncbi:hypothetical protein PSY31_24000, partial [Shigella flexneri]|nr:hypothetical protein [Shigella flexneri]
TISHCYRETNATADSLAKWGATHPHHVFLHQKSLPEETVAQMTKDLTDQFTRTIKDTVK